MPHTLEGAAPLAFRTRTFETFTLTFASDSEALDVFESIKELTVVSTFSHSINGCHIRMLRLTLAASVTQLYAYNYKPNPPLPTNEGWKMFTPREEFQRMGVGLRTKAWRYTDINKDYSVSPPALISALIRF